MRRREFIAGLGGAAAWPLAARAQERSLPVVGLLTGVGDTSIAYAAFRKGLGETGFVEGRNVTIEYRSVSLLANNYAERIREVVADLVRRRVTVIAALSLIGAHEAKAATTTIPVVFRIGPDPVQERLVTSFNRPGGNITGISDISADLGPKRLQLLHDLLPGASRFGALVNPAAPWTETLVGDLQAAALAMRRSVEIINVITDGQSVVSISEIDAAFASLAPKRIDALLVDSNLGFLARRVQLVTLAAHHRIPAIYPRREFSEIGGLMSYGSDLVDQWRQVGIYTGRILIGEKPSDLPVMRPTKFELVINTTTAKTLGIAVPETLLATADELIQ